MDIRFTKTLAAIGLSFSSIGLSACVSYPTETTVQGGQSSAIYFSAFPAEALVQVDGVTVGTVADYNGEDQTLAVEPGTHSVAVILNGAAIYEKRVFVGRNSSLAITR